MFYTEWDEEKAAENQTKHRIGFEAASSVFDDPFSIIGENLEFEGEQRFEAIGAMRSGPIVHVTYLEWVEEQDTIARMISARKATPRERRNYEQNRKTGSRNNP